MMKEKLESKKDEIRCCYKITDTDVAVLLKMVEIEKPITSEELADIFKLSKTTVENSLKKLIELGLVVRTKTEGKKIGRPKYYYSISTNILEKIRTDLLNCAKRMELAAT
ncbi:HTH domain-containing protein [Sulfolobus sp. S-194]|uniref:helix-turn-helix domain-containing protein n=1 Tax=Sulfolobus sp. S-194 TaxID=2512240 RepID=UPI0014373332|nr:helix-turn-helix domain-containing protein [Sulfolobus sp. S-194]QIW24795.1 HTH domain-containing protein [Sulfolobus sp. S-194]